MKKLKLKALELGASDVLSREQLKNVMGAAGSCIADGNSCSIWGPPCCGYCTGAWNCARVTW